MTSNNFEDNTIEIVTTEQAVGSATPAAILASLRYSVVGNNLATIEDIDRISRHTSLVHFRGRSIGEGIVVDQNFLILIGIFLEPCHIFQGNADHIECYRIHYLYCDADDDMYIAPEYLDRTTVDFEVVRENNAQLGIVRDHFDVSNYVFDETTRVTEDVFNPQGLGEVFGSIAGGCGEVAALPQVIDKCARDLSDIHVTVTELADVITTQTGKVRDLAQMFAEVDAKGVALMERILSRVEDFGLAAVGLVSSTSWQSAVVILLQYFKTFVPGSALKLLAGKFEDLRKAVYRLRYGEMAPQGMEYAPGEFISWLNSNWTTIRTSEAASKIGDVVTICLTFLCGGTNTERFISSKAFEFFRLKAWNPSKGGALGFVDTVLSTLQFCIEKGATVIETGSIASIFYTEDQWKDIDLDYIKLMEWSKVVTSNRLRSISDISEGVFTSEEDYRFRLNDVKLKLYEYRKIEKNPVNQQRIDGMILKLGTIAVTIRMQKKSASYKEAPFCVMYYGDSSINKSLLMNATAKLISQVNGRPSGYETICSPNESDKYDTEYNDEVHNTLFIDDILNTKLEWYDAPPTDRLLRVKNNQPHTVLKADVDSKGVMTWLVKTMIMSTNVKDLKAHCFSNLAASIMRRIDYVVTAYLKDSFKDELGGFKNPTDEVLPSAWNFRVQRIKLVAYGGYEFVEEFSTAEVSELMEFLAARSMDHTTLQKKIVGGVESLFTEGFCSHFKIGNCDKCGGVDKLCPPPDYLALAKQATLEPAFQDACSSDEEITRTFGSDFDAHLQACRDSVGESPDVMMQTRLPLMEMLKSYWHIGALSGLAAITVASIISISRSVMACLYPQSVREISPAPIDGERENTWKARKFRSVPLIRRSQLSASTNWNDLIRMVSRDMRACKIECGGNKGLCNLLPLGNEYWLGPAHSLVHDVPFTVILADCRKGELGIDGVSEIKRPIDVLRVPGTDYAIVRLTATPPKRGFLRYFPESEIIGETVATCIYRPRTDFVPAVNASRSAILTAMEEDAVSNGCFTTMVNASAAAKRQVGDQAYNGYKYSFPPGTFNGLCGMALVIQARGAVILGLHLGGSESPTPIGIAGAITIAQLEDTISKFTPQHINLVGEGGVDDVQYGYSFDQEGLNEPRPIRPKHCMNFIDSEEPCAIEVYGEHIKGTRTLRSDVRTSVISETVTEVLGLPNLHGRPKGIGTWRPFQSNAQNMMVPCNEFDPALLEKAADDLFDHHMTALHDNYGEMSVHFVSADIAINGIPGMCGMDRIDLGTSAGHPVDKSKLTLVDMEKSTVDEYGVIEHVVFVDEVYDRVKILEQKALAGERLFSIFRANVKDEPTKLTKEQLRIFAGTPLDYLIVCKRALSALNRVMQIHWFRFECCISANCYDDDWTTLYNSIQQPGCEDRFFCGDYKHWDKTLSPTLLRAAAGVILRLCRQCGYTDDELTITNAVLLELIYPIYEWDGVYAQFLSSMPSGVFLTVMMSNICNGILFRYTYYANAPEGSLFSQHVKCNFMGDDNLGTVSKECTWWDQTVHAKILGEIGIEYTSADKKSALTPFVSRDNVTYLKRRFVWDNEMNNFIAPIEEASIGKVLHNYMKRKRSNDTPDMISGNAIDHAVNEWFRHGRAVFETRTAQLMEVIKRHNLYNYCHILINNRMPYYGEMVEKYHKAIVQKYHSREAKIRNADPMGDEALLLDFSFQ